MGIDEDVESSSLAQEFLCQSIPLAIDCYCVRTVIVCVLRGNGDMRLVGGEVWEEETRKGASLYRRRA